MNPLQPAATRIASGTARRWQNHPQASMHMTWFRKAGRRTAGLSIQIYFEGGDENP